jgi:hypothetical protein
MNHLKGAARYIFAAKIGHRKVPFRRCTELVEVGFRGKQEASIQNSIFGALIAR